MTAERAYGPAVGEPPVAVDPRRWGGLIGMVGGLVFVATSSAAFGAGVRSAALAVAAALALAALYRHYVRPVALGPAARPERRALALYGACVVGEIALIALGTAVLVATDRTDLRPALIAAVVGLHVLPMARAFAERMFLLLGALMAVVGAAGLVLGAAGVPRAGDGAALVAGLVLLSVGTGYAWGAFAPGAGDPARSGATP